MKQPLYALLIAPITEMRQAILNGTKKVSICEGHRDYKVGGKIMLCCHFEPFAVMADIVSVEHTKLWKVTEKEWKQDGFDDQASILHGLRKFYPILRMDSPVTVIRWDNISGKLVEEVERIKALKKHYPQDCQCAGFPNLIANDCHVHNEFPRHFIDDDNLDCDCYSWKNTKTTCDKCDEPAIWVRKTQFSGDHFFCDADAKVEKDFGQEDPSYFYWIKIE
ncbi:MAG: ASCH domain-containing protein [Patescibacteria group bacterium]